MKLFQITFGYLFYFLLISVVSSFIDLFFVNDTNFVNLALFFIFVIIFKISPHPQRTNYPFAFRMTNRHQF